MCSKNEYTKSESNSQHNRWKFLQSYDCVQRTNIQNLKAIHNPGESSPNPFQIVFKERIYKIWKQFTTAQLAFNVADGLCSKNEYTKSESNSQHCTDNGKITLHCVQRTNIQNLKAIHNCKSPLFPLVKIVFKERIYKIWKQFTTEDQYNGIEDPLCSKNEYTKSESNSQRQRLDNEKAVHCVQRTNIQNLKAIHNLITFQIHKNFIVFKERIYKIWKQFTTNEVSGDMLDALCSKNEYTKSESNSQPTLPALRHHRNCVQRTNIQNLKAIHNRYVYQCSAG